MALKSIPQHLTMISANKANLFARILQLGLNLKQIQQVYEYARNIKEKDTKHRNFILVICDADGEEAFQYQGKPLTHNEIDSSLDGAIVVDIIDSADFENNFRYR